MLCRTEKRSQCAKCRTEKRSQCDKCLTEKRSQCDKCLTEKRTQCDIYFHFMEICPCLVSFLGCKNPERYSRFSIGGRK